MEELLAMFLAKQVLSFVHPSGGLVTATSIDIERRSNVTGTNAKGAHQKNANPLLDSENK